MDNHPTLTTLKWRVSHFIGLLLFLLIITVGPRLTAVTKTRSLPTDRTSMQTQSYIIQGANLEAAETAVTQINGRITHQLGIINGVAADLTAAQYDQLSGQNNLNLHENGTIQSASAPLTTVENSTCTVYQSSDVPKAISSVGTFSINSILDIPAQGTIQDINLVNLQGKHTYVGDLAFNLISPQGTDVQLFNASACGWRDDFSLTLDDESVSTIPCAPTGGGTHQPHNPLSTFDGNESQGRWTLRVTDNYNYDGGSLDGWGLEICTASEPTVDEPTAEPTPAAPPEDTSAYADYVVRDEFNTRSYGNSDGATDWTQDWAESDAASIHTSEENHPFGGYAQVVNGQLSLSSMPYTQISRMIPMKDVVSATLSFTYQRNFYSTYDYVSVEFTEDPHKNNNSIAGIGGLTHAISGVGSDATPQQVEIDLTPYLENGGDAFLSFSTSQYFSGASSFKVDDVQIRYRIYAPDVDFPTQVNAHQVHDQGVTGDEVVVAVVDTGMGYEQNIFRQEDWATEPQGSYPYRVKWLYDAIEDELISGNTLQKGIDDSGHGTHVSSLIASSQTNNENGRKNGIAPRSSILPVRAFDSNGNATYADVIRGIDWIVANKDTYNIRIINASFFSEVQSYYWEDPLNQAIMKAWQAGIVVVASAGNIPAADNHAMTIGAPGNIPYIITVGGMTDNYTPDDPTDDRIVSFSAMGPTAAKFIKPDVVAPGGHIRGYMANDDQLVLDHPHLFDEGDYFTMSGTSQSAAVVSGIVALMLDANPNLTPDDVKCRLMTTARATLDVDGNLAAPIYAQGAGMVDAFAAVNSTASRLCQPRVRHHGRSRRNQPLRGSC